MSMLELAMELIAGAGDSKSDSMEAIMHAKAGNLQQARQSLEKAGLAMQSTHEVQTQLIRDEMTGSSTEAVTLLMVHAQDHLTGAMMMRDLAMEFTDLYERVEKLEREMKR